MTRLSGRPAIRRKNYRNLLAGKDLASENPPENRARGGQDPDLLDARRSSARHAGA
jgi:hypothetical protein